MSEVALKNCVSIQKSKILHKQASQGDAVNNTGIILIRQNPISIKQSFVANATFNQDKVVI
jgi:hypothetical protein